MGLTFGTSLEQLSCGNFVTEQVQANTPTLISENNTVFGYALINALFKGPKLIVDFIDVHDE